jgi:hypothetical protein
MLNNFIIVLFKNKKKRKIIKSYAKEKTAKNKFKEIIKENDKIRFEKIVENATESNYEIGLLTNQTKIQNSLFITDELGRNNVVNLEDPEYVFLDIKKYKVEEKIYDWQTDSKINFDEMMSKYCNPGEFKSIFTLNNKLCIQVDENMSLFSLKNSEESDRLLETIQEYFLETNRMDALFVRDFSNAQRKWLYEVLVKMGFDKKRLYRLKTTFSKR